jgi:hypothetical protein
LSDGPATERVGKFQDCGAVLQYQQYLITPARIPAFFWLPRWPLPQNEGEGDKER